MAFDRRVQVRVRRADTQARAFGTGSLIGPRLVLTSAHVLDGVSGAARPSAPDGAPLPVTVSLPGAGAREFPGTVRWLCRDEDVDAALVEVTEDRAGPAWPVPESLGDPLTRPAQRFGLIIGGRPHPVTVTGFPRMQKDPGGRRLDEQLTGHIVPGTGSLDGRYEVTATGPVLPGETAQGSARSRWSGMSGAAVLADDGFGGDLLCGVVRRDRQAEGGTRLIVTPAARLVADDAFRAVVAEHTGWEPVLEPAEPVGLFAPAVAGRLLASPAWLLRADAEAVAFHGRDAELADLRGWCAGGPPAASVRVLTGPGGQGKTRLARRLTELLGREGWVTGHLRADLTDYDAALPDLSALSTELPLLVVVDYAETRPRLLRHVIAHLHRSRHRVRLLLLARSDGRWRTDALNAVPGARALLADAVVGGLGPLISRERPEGDRGAAFTAAARDLARLLPHLPTLPPYDWAALADRLGPPAGLGGARYDSVLTLHLTALVGLLQHGPRPVGPRAGGEPEAVLLQHEERFWEDSARTPAFRLELPTPTLGAAVAAAALSGAAGRDEAERVLAAVPGVPAGDTHGTAGWLRLLYPADPGRHWGSLQPDRIAEFHASRVLMAGDLDLPALLSAASPGQQSQALVVLARAAVGHYNAERDAESARLLDTVSGAVTAAAGVLAPDVLLAVTNALGDPTRIFAPLAVSLTSLLVRSQREQVAGNRGDESDLALFLGLHAAKLGDLGRGEEALAAGEEAVAIVSRLAARDPGHLPRLAGMVSDLSSKLAAVGRRDEALAASRDAVTLHREVARYYPGDLDAAFAQALTSLGLRLSASGHLAEALSAEAEAITVRRRLTARDPAAHESRLATSLSNLAGNLGQLGHLREAMAAEGEALAIVSRLAAENPALHESELAACLSNLGGYLAYGGDHRKAVDCERNAIAVRRRLAAGNPAVHEPDLARSLSNLASHLSGTRRYDEAAAAAEEAVAIRRRLTALNPALYAVPLAKSLLNAAQARHGKNDAAGRSRAIGEIMALCDRYAGVAPELAAERENALRLRAHLR